MKDTHEHSSVFPAMTAEEFDALADDIAANGLLEPIVLLDGLVLDGRHRDRACAERGVQPRYADWDPACGITPLEWVVSRNLHRRQLTHGQRAALALELKDQLGIAARSRMSDGGKGIPISGDLPKQDRSRRSDVIAAKAFKVGHSAITALQPVRDRDPELFAKVKSGEIGVEPARKAAGLPPSGGKPPGPRTRQTLADAMDPLRRYLKNWNEERLRGVTPKQAQRLLKHVQEIDQALFEVERALEERAVTSRALT